MKAKKSFEEWIDGKWENRGSYWISLYEKRVIGFAESDLSHYTENQIKKKYEAYLKR